MVIHVVFVSKKEIEVRAIVKEAELIGDMMTKVTTDTPLVLGNQKISFNRLKSMGEGKHTI